MRNRKALTSVPFSKITSVSSIDEGRGPFGATNELLIKTGSEEFEFEFPGGDKAQRAYRLIIAELLQGEPACRRRNSPMRLASVLALALGGFLLVAAHVGARAQGEPITLEGTGQTATPAFFIPAPESVATFHQTRFASSCHQLRLYLGSSVRGLVSWPRAQLLTVRDAALVGRVYGFR